MSKAFVKDDAQDEQITVSPRAPLPPGTPNHVTPRGLALLKAELAELTAERSRLQADEGDEAERTRQLVAVGVRLDALEARLEGAEMVKSHIAPQDEVAFGTTVTARTLTGKFAGEELRVTLVGVDEAAVTEGSVAFTAPIARALLGHKVGEKACLQIARGEQVLEVVAVDHGPE